MTATYDATIRHHSIARARTISVTGTLTQAKRKATAEFGADYQDYEIVIFRGDEVISSRRLSDKRWADRINY